MISKKTLKEYKFTSIEDYYNYIIEFEDKGQYEQVKRLLFKMSLRQNIEFLKYCNDINMIKYFTM